MSRPWAIWLLPLVLALHNLEEGIFFPRYVPCVLAMVPAAVAFHLPGAIGVMFLGRAISGSG